MSGMETCLQRNIGHHRSREPCQDEAMEAVCVVALAHEETLPRGYRLVLRDDSYWRNQTQEP